MTLKADAAVSGVVKVEVRKDVVLGSDVTYKVFEKTVTLREGENIVEVGRFTADVLTSNSIGSVRQYFVRVYWDGELIYDPQNPDTRECVFTKPKTATPKTGEVGYGGVEFQGEG
ncbi:MAG: hypothetical protein FGF50_08630 [Candidatus Brockarchaeota archaeon]|nr:hypothetical protein [Candidatus Brockarchaeota archaeon]